MSTNSNEHKSLWYLILNDYRYTLGTLVVILVAICLISKSFWDQLTERGTIVLKYVLYVSFIVLGIRWMFGKKPGSH